MQPEKLYEEIINNLWDGVYFVDIDRRIAFWNKAAEDITGYTKEEVINEFCQGDLLNHIDKEGCKLCLCGCPLHATLIDGRRHKANVFLRHKEGHRVPVRVNIFPIIEDGDIIGAVEIFSPISSDIYDEGLIESLSNLAMSDHLTGLANRRKLESYLEYRLLEMKRFRSKFCVIFLDLDDFRMFNNKYGHETGDEILISISKSIVQDIRQTDLFGRWGGEEFLGVFEIKNDYEAVLMAEKIRVLIYKCEIPYEGESISVTASLGVTVAHEDDTVESITKRADSLMYLSKQNNKNRVTSDI